MGIHRIGFCFFCIFFLFIYLFFPFSSLKMAVGSKTRLVMIIFLHLLFASGVFGDPICYEESIWSRIIKTLLFIPTMLNLLLSKLAAFIAGLFFVLLSLIPTSLILDLPLLLLDDVAEHAPLPNLRPHRWWPSIWYKLPFSRYFRRRSPIGPESSQR